MLGKGPARAGLLGARSEEVRAGTLKRAPQKGLKVRYRNGQSAGWQRLATDAQLGKLPHSFASRPVVRCAHAFSDQLLAGLKGPRSPQGCPTRSSQLALVVHRLAAGYDHRFAAVAAEGRDGGQE